MIKNDQGLRFIFKRHHDEQWCDRVVATFGAF